MTAPIILHTDPDLFPFAVRCALLLATTVSVCACTSGLHAQHGSLADFERKRSTTLVQLHDAHQHGSWSFLNNLLSLAVKQQGHEQIGHNAATSSLILFFHRQPD